MLCLPVKIHSKRFIKTVRMLPVMDELLKQLPDYEFIAYNQDRASILFYSQELKRVKNLSSREDLEKTLSAADNRPRFCYLSQEDFAGLTPSVKQGCRIILKYKDRLIISSQQNPAFFVTLP